MPDGDFLKSVPIPTSQAVDDRSVPSLRFLGDVGVIDDGSNHVRRAGVEESRQDPCESRRLRRLEMDTMELPIEIHPGHGVSLAIHQAINALCLSERLAVDALGRPSQCVGFQQTADVDDLPPFIRSQDVDDRSPTGAEIASWMASRFRIASTSRRGPSRPLHRSPSGPLAGGPNSLLTLPLVQARWAHGAVGGDGLVADILPTDESQVLSTAPASCASVALRVRATAS